MALVRRYVDAVNSGGLEVIDDLFASDYVNHRPTGPEVGPAAMREFVASVRKTLPDISMSIDEMIADGDKVGVRVTLRGTSTVFGRSVTIPEIQIYRIANGTIAERWFVVDRSELQQSASATSKGE